MIGPKKKLWGVWLASEWLLRGKVQTPQWCHESKGGTPFKEAEKYFDYMKNNHSDMTYKLLSYNKNKLS